MRRRSIFELMTSKNAKFEWTSAHREAFARIKEEIASAGMLHNLDYKLPIIVRTDASTRGVGAVLCQRDGNRWRNVAFVSKRFSGAATRWSTIDQESFAIFFALKSWKTLIQGHRFVVETDHKNIVHIMGSTEGRLTRWRLLLQELDFSVQDIPGRENKIADALSRCWWSLTRKQRFGRFIVLSPVIME